MAPRFLVILGTRHAALENLEASYERYEKYLSWLKRQPLSEQTRRAYRSRINHFLGFLGTSGEDLRVLIENERERAHILREYKRHLKQELKSRPATVNAYLTAIDHFFQFHGVAPGKVAREDLPQDANARFKNKEQEIRKANQTSQNHYRISD